MRLITLLLLCLALAGCAAFDGLSEGVSGISDYFMGGEDNSDPPAVLVEYTPEIKIEEIWQESVGDGADEQSLKLVPANWLMAKYWLPIGMDWCRLEIRARVA